MMAVTYRRPLCIQFWKRGERYLFRFHPEKLTELLRVFGRYASDRDLSFTWYDAAMASAAARAMVKREAAKAAGGGDE